MRSAKRWIDYLQIIAAIGLGLAYFLPLSQSFGSDKVSYADNAWILYFWTLPVLFVIFKISNKWLKALLCFLSVLGGLFDLVLITFAGTFKSTPLIGFQIAKLCLILLVISWLVLCIISLSTPRHQQVGN